MTDLTSLDAVGLFRALAVRDLSCLDVMTACLDRIEAINPAINAVVSLLPRDDLLAQARAADIAGFRGPLHGLPIAVKDLVEVAGIRSTHGSPIFANHVPKKDDLVAARLRAAGAILIGKTNTPEFGLGSHSYNPVHGVTRNPYDLSRTAGGSSGGAAAALAARLVPLADGSDCMGSLRNPAAFCNVYGFRPSFGLVPRDLVGDLFLNQIATEGPMARTVRDLAFLLDVLAGPVDWDPHSLPQQSSFLDGLNGPLRARRVAWIGDWNGYYPVEPEVIGLCETALKAFGDLGIEVEHVTPDFDPERLWHAWLALRAFNNAGSKRALYEDAAKRAQLKPELIWEIERGLSVTAIDTYDASVVRSQWYATVAKLFETYDAVVMPSAQVFPFDVGETWPKTVADKAMTTYHQWMEIVVPASIAGLPSLNVPVGFSNGGLPMGMQIIGPRGADLDVLKIGEAYHQATKWPERYPPDLDPSSVASAP